MRFLSEGIRRPNFIHEVSRIHAHSQSPIGYSCIRKAKCANAIHAGSVDADPLEGIKRDSLSRYLHPFF